MPIIRRLKADGYHVIVLTQFDGYELIIGEEVDEIKPLFISRKGINPFIDFFTFLDFVKTLALSKPDLVMFFTIKPVIYGSIAARLVNVKSIAMITGLGTAFIANNWITKVAKFLYRFALSSVSLVFFQNIDDKDLFVSQKLVDAKVCRLTPGSGVDLDKFSPVDLPLANKITFLLIGRMLWDKGVGEFVDAARVVKTKTTNVEFQLLGPLGVENRTAISKTQMENWVKEGVVQYLGETDCVGAFIEKASCVVLPSYREGTSRVLLEAAAMGRPIITTNVTGCREIVDHGVNGFLCKLKSPLDLEKKMMDMAVLSQKEREEMGGKGRQKVENEFDQEIVCQIYIDAIQELGI
jgi:glycosyltransferase involved in cell wall biosynthesis